MSYNYEDYVPNQGIVCPICQQACASLQALNVHIDTVHSEEDTKGALLSWFKQAQKKVQTTLIKQPSTSTSSSPISSFKSFTALDQSSTFLSQIQQLTQTELPDYFVCETERYIDNVTRDHWQHESNHDTCYIRGCGKILNKGNNGKQHCRKCGHLFCDFHTKYEIKLNNQAQHDPENGVWAKVCGNCFMEREDYANHQGAIRDKSSIFLQRRAKIIDKVYLETNRLEKRLEKLARIHYNIDSGKGYAEKILNHSSSSSFINIEKSDSASSSGLSVSSGTMSPKSSYMSSTSNSNSILSMKLKYRDGEQNVTKWQDDKGIKKCPLCLTAFTLTNRKHHCRLCGRVICGAKHCSSMIPLFLNMSTDNINEEPVGDTRACQDCKRVAFRRKIQNEESNLKQPIFKLYHQLTVTRHYIEKLLPKFHSMILILEQEKIVQQDHETFKKAALVRKSVLDNFALYDTLVKSIKSLPTQTSSMKRLQSNICIAANLYLQQNMLPLQMLPRILNTTTSSSSSKKNKKINSNGQQQQEQLLSQLQIYEEQFILVQGYISDAKKHRKYDEVKTLTISLNELQTEIDRLKQTISK
ncbi:FYVE zinc finger-domain-containing protein [Cunninghamella echinulata]|nr:FYVE zinc finger-domain-containing protein [Cunninghamella echinulata]